MPDNPIANPFWFTETSYVNYPTMTIGSDPEFMLYDMTKQKIVSAIGVLKNDKHTPIDLGNGIKMYADNVLVEFSFPPSESASDFIMVLAKVLQLGQDRLGPNYRLVAKAAHVYDPEELKDPKAIEGGCSPNFDVYEECQNLPPAFDGGLRTGSFHIHVGSEMLKTRERKDLMIKLLDCYLGVPSTIFDTDPTANKRRALYGKAGEFRPTPYGIEYRVLGPWALRSPATVLLCLDLVAIALKALITRINDHDFTCPLRESTSRDTINRNDREEAQSRISSYLPRAMVESVMTARANDLYRDWQIKV